MSNFWIELLCAVGLMAVLGLLMLWSWGYMLGGVAGTIAAYGKRDVRAEGEGK